MLRPAPATNDQSDSNSPQLPHGRWRTPNALVRARTPAPRYSRHIRAQLVPAAVGPFARTAAARYAQHLRTQLAPLTCQARHQQHTRPQLAAATPASQTALLAWGCVTTASVNRTISLQTVSLTTARCTAFNPHLPAPSPPAMTATNNPIPATTWQTSVVVSSRCARSCQLATTHSRLFAAKPDHSCAFVSKILLSLSSPPAAFVAVLAAKLLVDPPRR